MTLGQVKLFDAASGEVLRDAAVEQVGRYADPNWLMAARQAIVDQIPGAKFTTDDLWELVGAPREPRAMGAAMTAARKEGLISALDEHKLSVRPECHRRPLRVWRRLG